MGDMIYEIALGFWVLVFTGSPVLMGILMVTSLLPGVLLAPFAGVVVDRTSRKKLMLIMDLIRGLTIILLVIAAFMSILQLWVVFLVYHSGNRGCILWARSYVGFAKNGS
jgi:MFS family permease